MILESGYSVLNGSLFNNYNDGIIIVNAEGFIKDINQKACEMLSIYRREVINESFNRTFQDLLQLDNLTDNTIYVNDYCLSVKVIPTPFGTNILLENRSYIEEISSNIFDNNMNNIVKLLNSSDDGLSIVDRDGIIIHANKTLLHNLEIASKEVIGRVSTSLVSNGIINEVTFRHVLRNKKKVDLKQVVTRRKNRLLTTAVPILSPKGEIEYIVSTSRDLNRMQQISRTANKTTLIAPKRSTNEVDDFIKMLRNEGNVIESKSMVDAFIKIKKVKDTEAPVLLIGETGAGKEVFANTLHEKGLRKNRAYIKVNCGAIPSELLESELFGYEDGAFTGAKKGGKKGLFELANGGTIFLDEITTLSLPLQSKLLRVLQEHEIMRIGGAKTIKIDTRIIAAANDLDKKLKNGEFREDLYYRLNVVQIKIPPLRDRPEDIAQLVTQYTTRLNLKYNKNVSFSSSAMALLNLYTWPGNVRELINVIEKCVILSNKNIVDTSDLPEEINSDVVDNGEELEGLKEVLYKTEKALIEKSMLYYGSTRKAAKALGVSQPTIVRKLQQYADSSEITK
ncbi:sigma 54-interacting transcriptional regulator [Bacillus benzoevorans]|uniref:HTH-type transcriptional regulatory protein TyrR n=1 Tax=Bacillus benzoevorans TaxID=1456 RepID=A0A7X0HU71_9BACI|nr:sigma 54-interacting transcriptional regulator [Bacillus benzoevorans]MBB6446881.1 PAS domain S-box-containing protein [Bacillus benzoevorans]